MDIKIKVGVIIIGYGFSCIVISWYQY